MHSYTTSTHIDADAQKVWDTLVDIDSCLDWNTTLPEIDESAGAIGDKIKLLAKVNPDRGFDIKVEGLEAPNKMLWGGGMPLGFFRGERTSSIDPQASGFSSR